MDEQTLKDYKEYTSIVGDVSDPALAERMYALVSRLTGVPEEAIRYTGDPTGWKLAKLKLLPMSLYGTSGADVVRGAVGLGGSPDVPVHLVLGWREPRKRGKYATERRRIIRRQAVTGICRAGEDVVEHCTSTRRVEVGVLWLLKHIV